MDGYAIGVTDARIVFPSIDRKSTRLNSSHSQISHAVFCLKKKPQADYPQPRSQQIVRFYAAIGSLVVCVSFAFCFWLEERCTTSRLCTSTSKASSVRTSIKPRLEKRRKPRCSLKSAKTISMV